MTHPPNKYYPIQFLKENKECDKSLLINSVHSTRSVLVCITYNVSNILSSMFLDIITNNTAYISLVWNIFLLEIILFHNTWFLPEIAYSAFSSRWLTNQFCKFWTVHCFRSLWVVLPPFRGVGRYENFFSKGVI